MIEIQAARQFEELKIDVGDGLGRHVLADFFDVEAMPTRADELQSLMIEAARLIGATVVTSSFHEFSPHGLSGVVVIAESHLAAHTWPENSTVCIDLFTCSSEMDPLPGLQFLFQQMKAGRLQLSQHSRGRQITDPKG